MGPSGPRVLRSDGGFTAEGGGIALTGDEYEVSVTYSPSRLPSGGTLTLSTDDIHLYWMMCAFIIFLCVVAFKVCSDVAHVWSGAYQLR